MTVLTEHKIVPAQVKLGRPHPDTGPVAIAPPADKAISQRATLLAALTESRSKISNLADCRDTRANLRAIVQLGVNVDVDGTIVTIHGVGPGGFAYSHATLDAGNSATTARLLIATLAGSRVDCTVDGNNLLRNRPMSWLVDPLRQLGGHLTYLGKEGKLPIRVTGKPLHGGAIDVDIDSAQPVSGLLFAGLAASGQLTIGRRTPARDHTERLLRWTGVDVVEDPYRLVLIPTTPKAFDLTVPGDPSAAAVLAALHLASPQAISPLRLEGVCLNPRRLGFFRALCRLGANVSWRQIPDCQAPEPVGVIEVRGPLGLSGGTLGGRELIQAGIDELPLLAALSCRGEHPLVIRDANELRHKDTDRIDTTVSLLTAFGIDAHATADGFIVYPSEPKAPAELTLPPDHRLVFAGCTLAVLAGGEMVLHGVDAASTSYPTLLKDLAAYLPVVVL